MKQEPQQSTQQLTQKQQTLAVLLLFFCLIITGEGFNDDRFNYGETNLRERNYGPEDWDKVTCDNVTVCTGWPDGWETGQGWQLEENSCRHCPAQSGLCAHHHQSPIPLRRGTARLGRPDTNICADEHWMKYEDSTCTWQQLESSFSIQRHSLRLDQPIEFGDEGFRIACPGPNGTPRRFGRIDFSQGYNFWWFLSHMDVKIPSEHTQNGKRYSAEVQLAHFFSAGPEERIHDNELATIGIFLEASLEYPPYPYLDRMICEWRRLEAKTKSECERELDQIPPYPGCFQEPQEDLIRRTTRETYANNRTTLREGLKQHQSQGKRVLLQEENYHADDIHRTLRDEYSHLHFHNYQFLIDVKTEYYFRYHGTMTIPPCYGPAPPDVEATHKNTNHWRVMKDPLRIAQRQLDEMERLLRERVAPWYDAHKPCQKDTAAAVDKDGHVSVARPLQSFNRQHDAVFCWCPMWPSKQPEDRAWCALNKTDGEQYMLFHHPYNFQGRRGF